MKNVSKAIVACFVVFATFMSSCDKEITTSSLTVDKSQKGTVQAIVYADLDQTNFGLELVPAGTRVILTIANSSLNPNATGNWIDTVTTDAQGKFLASVPTNATGVNVNFTLVDFIADQTQPLGSHSAKVTKLFQRNGALPAVNVKTSDFKIASLDYNTVSDLKDADNFVTISGKAFAELDGNSAGEENAPVVDVIFSYTSSTPGSSFSTKVTLSQNATNTIFTVNVPASTAQTGQLKYSYDFIAQKNVPDGSGGWKRVSYRYQGSTTLGSFSIDSDGQILDFGNGTLIQ